MKRLKKILARFRLTVMCKRQERGAITIPDDIVNARHVLVLLPPGQRELTMIKGLLPEITRVFSGAEIYILASPGSTVYNIFPRKGYRIMTPTSQHLDWSGLPKRSYIKTLEETAFDVIIDLNLGVNYFSQAILLSFGKALKIGRGNHLGTPYYNLEIKSRYIRDEKNIYKSIITTIDRIKNPAAIEAG